MYVNNVSKQIFYYYIYIMFSYAIYNIKLIIMLFSTFVHIKYIFNALKI